jgi:hypothetical protein
MDNDKQPLPITKMTPESVDKIEIPKKTSEELDILGKQVDITSNTKEDLDTFKIENLEEKSFITLIIEFLKNPDTFLAMLFGEESETEKSENLKKWGTFKDSSMLVFFEEIKETFSLTKENTDPENFNEKYEDEKFREIMEFQKEKSKKNNEAFSPETLMVLWSNKDNLSIKNKELVLKKESGSPQIINTENDKEIAESIVPKESVKEQIPGFAQTLKVSLLKYFSDIPQQYKDKIPEAIAQFQFKLEESVTLGKITQLSKTRKLSSIKNFQELNFFT